MENENIEKEELLQEIINRLGNAYWPLKVLGLGRYDISCGQIVPKSTSSMCFTILNILIVFSCTYYVLYELNRINYLIITETIIVFNFFTFNTFVLSSTFMNRNSAMKYLNTSIDLDLFLGSKETEFMREVTTNTYIYLCAFVGVTHLFTLLVLFFSYVVDLAIYITGGILFVFLYFIYYDLSLFISLYTTLTLRVRYLNVAILKLANVKLEYIPQQFPFNTVFWDKKYDDMVDFHLRAKMEKLKHGFILIFNQLRYLEKCYCFTIFCCLFYLTAGTFVTVQSWIIWAKSTDLNVFRILAVMGWCLLSWSFVLGLSQQTDMFQRQINQTSLICTYIQLKPTYPDEIYELTASIIRMLEVRDPRVSIYGMFFFDTGLLLRMSSSIFVYITMQLQIAFPKSPDTIVNNGTIDIM